MKRLAVSLLLCCPVVAEPFKIHHIGRPAADTEVRAVAKTTKWIGGTDTDWDVAGNWSNGIPANDDTVLVDSAAGNNLTTNVDRTGDNAGAGLNIDVFHIDSSSTIQVGSSGAPLKMTAGVVFKNNGSGQVYFTSAMGTGAGITQRLIQNGPGYFQYACTGATTVKGSIVSIELLRGNGLFDLDHVDAIQGLFIAAGISPPVATFSGDSDYTLIWMNGGDITWATTNTTSSVTSIIQAGGRMTYQSGSMSTLNMFGGAFYHDNITASQLGILNGLAGLFDSTTTPGVKTIQTARLNTETGAFQYIVDDRLVTVTTEYIIGQ